MLQKARAPVIVHECEGDHLVLGSYYCPECHPFDDDFEPRWEKDPYIVTHADLAYERDILKGDLNDTQLTMLMSVMIRRNQMKRDEAELYLESQLLVQDPERYKAYIEEKKRIKRENAGLEKEPIWFVPQTYEEAKALAEHFSDLDEKYKGRLKQEGVIEETEAGTVMKFDWSELNTSELGDD